MMAKRLQNTKYWIEGDIAGCGDKEEIPGGNDAGEFDKGSEWRGQRERYRKFPVKEQHKGRPGCADVQRRYFKAPPCRGQVERSWMENADSSLAHQIPLEGEKRHETRTHSQCTCFHPQGMSPTKGTSVEPFLICALKWLHKRRSI